MALKWASSMGEVHLQGSNSVQLTRYFATQSGMGSGSTTGLLSVRAMQEPSGFVRGPQLPEQNTWIVQGAFQNSGPMAGAFAQNAGLAFFRQGTEQLRMEFVPAGALGARQDGQLYFIEVKRGATVLATSAPLFYSEEWTIFQFKATVRTGSNGSFEVRAARVENQTIGAFSTILSGAALNSADAGVDGADQLEINFEVEGGSARWDHVWMMDDQGTINNDFPGKFLLVQGVVPNSNGAQEDWVYQGGQGSGFDALNDPHNSDSDDVGRATSNTVGDIVLMGFQIPGELGAPGFESGHPISSAANVQGVIFHHVSGMENSGNRTVSPIYRDIADVRADGTNVVLNSLVFSGFFEVFELEPVTSLAWTAQQTKDMQWGLKVQA